MVHHDDQHVFVGADAEKLCPQRDLVGQMEPVADQRGNGLLQPGCRPRRGVGDLPARVGGGGIDHALLGDTVGDRKDGAQRAVAARHIGDRRAQRLGVQPSR